MHIELAVGVLHVAGHGVLVSPHIHFDDHPAEEERTNTYAVVTVESIMKLLGRTDPGMKVHRLQLDQ